MPFVRRFPKKSEVEKAVARAEQALEQLRPESVEGTEIVQVGPAVPAQPPEEKEKKSKAARFRELAQALSEEALDVLASLMRDPDVAPSSRIAAANAILDRAWGKPTQPVAGDDQFDALRIVIVPGRQVDVGGAGDGMAGDS